MLFRAGLSGVKCEASKCSSVMVVAGVEKRETARPQGVYSSVGEYLDGSRRRTNRVLSRLGR